LQFSNQENALAVEEALTKGNHEADYLLFLDGKAIGVLEAKKKDNSLGNVVAEQTAKYSAGALPWYQTWANPLPFLFMSNGDILMFKNLLDKSGKFEPIKKMLTPKQLVKLAREFGIKIDSEFASLPSLPTVGPNGLRLCQREAITALEVSFKHGERRALLDMATGAGKTFKDWPEMVGYVMLSPYFQLEQDENGIAYTPFYYYDTIVNDDRTQVIGVNGVVPGKKTIENGTYPYVTEVMASVRSDTDKSSTTYQLFYQLATGQNNGIIKESGYSVIDHAGR